MVCWQLGRWPATRNCDVVFLLRGAMADMPLRSGEGELTTEGTEKHGREGKVGKLGSWEVERWHATRNCDVVFLLREAYGGHAGWLRGGR